MFFKLFFAVSGCFRLHPAWGRVYAHLGWPASMDHGHETSRRHLANQRCESCPGRPRLEWSHWEGWHETPWSRWSSPWLGIFEPLSRADTASKGCGNGIATVQVDQVGCLNVFYILPKWDGCWHVFGIIGIKKTLAKNTLPIEKQDMLTELPPGGQYSWAAKACLSVTTMTWSWCAWPTAATWELCTSIGVSFLMLHDIYVFSKYYPVDIDYTILHHLSIIYPINYSLHN